MNYKKFFGVVSYYMAPVALASLSFLFHGPDWYILLGKCALYLLAAILFVKPLAAILKINFLWTIVSLRRELGVLIFWFFFFHLAGAVYMYGLYRPEMWSYISAGMYFGLAAGFGLLILTLTSNNYAIKLLKRNWKRLHYISYLVLFLAFAHVALTTGQYLLYIVLSVMFVVLKAIEFRKSRQTMIK